MNDEPVEIPVIIEECKMAGCKNAAEINAYLAAEVSRLRFVKKQALKSEIQRVLSLNDAERGSNTPDFVLADYLMNCLCVYDAAVNARERIYGREPYAANAPDVSNSSTIA